MHKLTLNNNHPEILFPNYSKDKYGHRYCIAQCPYCSNFFKVRVDSLKNGNTKSCGCLKLRKRRNKYYFPLGCDFGIGYYDNTDYFFIFDLAKYDVISPYHWTDKNANDRHEPTANINGKTTSMARFLLEISDDREADHINKNPLDNRMCNLRIATRAENSQNRKNTKQDNPEYGEFTLRNSQEISKKIETNQFNNSFHFWGTLEKINALPEKNIFKIMLRNLYRNKLNGVLSEDNEAHLLFKLIDDYNSYYQST